MRLVTFLDAAEHVARVARVLRTPLGHALLLGVGGSGRRSLARLAAHVEEYETREIEITKSYGLVDWKDDLRAALKSAGAAGKDVAFIFSDTQVRKARSVMAADCGVAPLRKGSGCKQFDPLRRNQ